MNDIFRRAAAMRQANCYACTDEILAGLGEMYTADERFQKNLDRFGEGTAAVLSAAIQVYCGK